MHNRILHTTRADANARCDGLHAGHHSPCTGARRGRRTNTHCRLPSIAGTCPLHRPTRTHPVCRARQTNAAQTKGTGHDPRRRSRARLPPQDRARTLCLPPTTHKKTRRKAPPSRPPHLATLRRVWGVLLSLPRRQQATALLSPLPQPSRNPSGTKKKSKKLPPTSTRRAK